jgi:hypothetical protein
MRRMLFVLFALSLAGAASAQTPTGTPTSKLLVDEGGSDLATVQGFTYAYYPDTATTPTPIVMTCAGAASPFTCSSAFPAFTPGPHSLTVTAKNVAGESPKSPVLSFTFVLVPNAPQNIRIGDDELADADYVMWGAVSVAPAIGQEG